MTREFLCCVECEKQFPLNEVRYACTCGGLLSVERPKDIFPARANLRPANSDTTGPNASGVWRFRELVLDVPITNIVSHPEGATRLYERTPLSEYAGIKTLSFKHEGENPTGSFKDRGMTVAVTQAKQVNAKWLACASTGNTSAALAAYAAHAGIPAVVFVPAGKIAAGKLAQALAYGSVCASVDGDFDAAMRLVSEAGAALGAYLVNSLNPFRIEGQKTIIWELLAQRGWRVPDWIVVPAGNLGNTSAFGKALREAHAAGWIDRLPRIAAIQAAGASPFARAFKDNFKQRIKMDAETVATAIRIGDPVNWSKAVTAIRATNGVVHAVDDAAIMDAKRVIDQSGLGCEPASAASLAGARALASAGVIAKDADVVCILTGNILKDPDAAMAATTIRPRPLKPTLGALQELLAELKIR